MYHKNLHLYILIQIMHHIKLFPHSPQRNQIIRNSLPKFISSLQSQRKQHLAQSIQFLKELDLNQIEQILPQISVRINQIYSSSPYKQVGQSYKPVMQDLCYPLQIPVISAHIEIPQQPMYLLEKQVLIPFDKQLLKEPIQIAFQLFNCRNPSIIRPLIMIPSFFKHWIQIYNELLLGDSCFIMLQKIYIGIMVAAVIKSAYIQNLMIQMYLNYGGQQKYLINGVQSLEPKFMKIHKLVNLISEKPVDYSTKAPAVFDYLQDQPNAWDKAQIVQAIILVVFYKQFCDLASAFGVEIQASYNIFKINGLDKNSNRSSGKGSNKQINQDFPLNMQALLIDIQSISRQYPEQLVQVSEEGIQQSYLQHLQKSLAEKIFNKFYKKGKLPDKKRKQKVQSPTDWKEISVILKSFATKPITLLDKKYNHIKSLTYNTFGTNRNMNTEIFRSAIWQFSTNLMLNKKQRKVVKDSLKPSLTNLIIKICKTPEYICKNDFYLYPYQLQWYQISHIVILICQSKFYFCVSQLMKSFSQNQ